MELIEESDSDLSIEDGFVLYDAIRNFVIDNERMPMQNRQDSDQIMLSAFGEVNAGNLEKLANFVAIMSSTDLLQQTYELLNWIKDYRTQQKYGNKAQ